MSKQRQKGTEYETRVKRWIDGIVTTSGECWKAIRVGGAEEHVFRGDVHIMAPTGHKYQVECKRRKSAFQQLTRWLGKKDILIVRADYGKTMVTMTAETFEDLLEHWQASTQGGGEGDE